MMVPEPGAGVCRENAGVETQKNVSAAGGNVVSSVRAELRAPEVAPSPAVLLVSGRLFSAGSTHLTAAGKSGKVQANCAAHL